MKGVQLCKSFNYYCSPTFNNDDLESFPPIQLLLIYSNLNALHPSIVSLASFRVFSHRLAALFHMFLFFFIVCSSLDLHSLIQIRYFGNFFYFLVFTSTSYIYCVIEHLATYFPLYLIFKDF